jgi:hypothetical protein
MKTNLISALIAAGLGCAPTPLLAATRTISVNDVTVVEGQAAAFIVSLSAKSKEGIFVDYGTRDGSAVSSQDYAPRSGFFFGLSAILFRSGEVSHVVTVPTTGDTCDEPDEIFFLDLKNPMGPATIGKGTGTCTILDNDGSTRCCCSRFGFCISLVPVVAAASAKAFLRTPAPRSASPSLTSSNGPFPRPMCGAP